MNLSSDNCNVTLKEVIDEMPSYRASIFNDLNNIDNELTRCKSDSTQARRLKGRHADLSFKFDSLIDIYRFRYILPMIPNLLIYTVVVEWFDRNLSTDTFMVAGFIYALLSLGPLSSMLSLYIFSRIKSLTNDIQDMHDDLDEFISNNSGFKL